MPTTALALNQIGQISVNVRDNIPRAVQFYRDTLGMPYLFETPRMAFFDCSGIRLMLSMPENAEFDHPGSVIYYRVDDIQATTDGLKARGVTFESEPHLVARLPDREIWMGFFRDPDRNLLAIMQEKKG